MFNNETSFSVKQVQEHTGLNIVSSISYTSALDHRKVCSFTSFVSYTIFYEHYADG
jgi:hypothetical protein